MSSKCKISVVLLLAVIAINCSDPPAPKKGITRYYITKLTMPAGWEDQFQYANDTLIDQIQVYKDGQLLSTQKPTWNGDQALVIVARGYPLDEIISTRQFKFAGATINRIIGQDFYPKYDYEYNFSFDSQSRLDSYIYSCRGGYQVPESGKATWLTDSLSVLQKAGTQSRVFGVKFEGDGASPWSGLSPEALATIMFQEINILECFVPGKINTLGSSSYGYYSYDEYIYDSDNNLTSLRRTNTTTGKVEYFKFEWKKVLL
jgi:hypothetical protein